MPLQELNNILGYDIKSVNMSAPFLLEMSTPTHPTPQHILAGSEQGRVVSMF